MTRSLVSLDANFQALDGGAMFGHVPRALWSAWIQPDARHRVRLATRALLVREAGRNVLFEAGIGGFFDPALRDRFGVEGEGNELLTSLAREGLGPEDIDVVVLSHLHFDHAGGLLADWRPDRRPALAFPRARFIVHRDAFARALHPQTRDRASFVPELQALLLDSGRLDLVGAADAPDRLGAGFRFHISEGHTPGLLLTELHTPRGPLLFVSDLAPGRAWLRPTVGMGYDRCAERLVEEKTALLGDLAARGGSLFLVHDPAFAVVRLTASERGGFAWADGVARLRLVTGDTG
jgi:glyoxylase-like metal-dependent hydrolase (beta-lactamase superfamily II)